MQGINREDLSKTVEDLLKSYLLTKGASYISFENAPESELSTQWQSAPLHHFLKAAVQLKETDLFIEWTYFLKKKSISFPLNILIPLMEWARNDLNLAKQIVPFLGPLGQQLAAQFPEFHILSERHHENPLQFSKSDLRIFAFERFRDKKPDAAFNYFMQIHQELKDVEKIKYLRILHVRLIQDEWNALQILLNPKKIILHQELMYIKLKTDVSAFNNQQVQFQYYLSENSLDAYYLKISSSIEQAIRLSPLRFLINDAMCQTYFNWIQEKEFIPALLRAIDEQNFSVLAIACFEFLLKHQALHEGLPLDNLSHTMDHASFNRCCIKWIETEQDAIDLEAFLMFIRSEKLFWTDDLLLKIIALRTSKALQRKYDFSVFWQLLPYKINPFSEQILQIPDECRIYFNSLIHFESILQFRKGIRK